MHLIPLILCILPITTSTPPPNKEVGRKENAFTFLLCYIHVLVPTNSCYIYHGLFYISPFLYPFPSIYLFLFWPFATLILDCENFSWCISFSYANMLLTCAALAKAQQQLLDSQEREYVLSQVKAAKGQLPANL